MQKNKEKAKAATCGLLQTGTKGSTPTSAWPLPRGKPLVPVRIATGTNDRAPVPVVQSGLEPVTNRD
jgi:hypothetical protein